MRIQSFFHEAKHGWQSLGCSEDSDKSVLLLVFGHTRYLNEPATLNELHHRYPNAVIMGCSTAGEFTNGQIYDDRLSVTAVNFDKSTIRNSSVSISSAKDSFNAGKQLAQNLLSDNLKGIFVLSDGIGVNGSELVKGLSSVLPQGIALTGGLAGDGVRFEKSWVINQDGKAEQNCIAAVGFYGDDIQIGYGTESGWDIFGPERRVTRSEGNIVYEIDGQPALALYKKYLGTRAADLPASGLMFPLSIREENNSQQKIIRTILSVDEDTQSMLFAGDVPEGCYCQLMTAVHDRLIQEAADAGKRASNFFQPNSDKQIAIAISCVGRRLVLGERTEEELEAVMNEISEQSELIGFYSYGEICPIENRQCELHNQTMTLTVISEK